MKSIFIGERIKKFREEKKMTREEVCEDETYLTYKHLGNIERGEVTPTLQTLDFISKRLNISISEIIGEKIEKLPKRYLELKHLLFHGKIVYRVEERADLVDNYFDEIYDHFFDDLPKEEQLTIELKHSLHEINMTSNFDFGKELLNEHFETVYQKERFNLNDLLIVVLYFSKANFEEKYNPDISESLFFRVKTKMKSAIDLELIAIDYILDLLSGVLLTEKKYDELKEILSLEDKIREKSFDFRGKPVSLMLKGKCALFADKDIQKAQSLYQQAITMAELIEDDFLPKKIQEEWENDLSDYKGIK